MSKYQEALEIIESLDYREIYQGQNNEHIITIKNLLQERIEFESRKEKLIVGSEWECVVTQYIDFDGYLSGKGEKYKIIKFSSEHYVIVATLGDVNKTYEILIDQLLYSFKPIEKGE